MHITIFYLIVKQKQIHVLLLYVENIQSHYINTKNNSKCIALLAMLSHQLKMRDQRYADKSKITLLENEDIKF